MEDTLKSCMPNKSIKVETHFNSETENMEWVVSRVDGSPLISSMLLQSVSFITREKAEKAARELAREGS